MASTDDHLAAEFEPLLRAELDDSHRSARDTVADRAPVTLDQQSVGRLARVDALQMQAKAQAADRRREGRRMRIAATLKRLAEGEFGYCIQCGRFIGLGRLRADATSTQCVGCAKGA